MYTNNINSPFPKEMRGDASNGSHCIIVEGDKNRIRYIAITVKKYMPENVKKHVKDGHYLVEEIYPEVIHLGYIPLYEKTFWLYHLQTYFVKESQYETFDDLFHEENVSNYESLFFDDINKVLEYCFTIFHVKIDQFQKRFDEIKAHK